MCYIHKTASLNHAHKPTASFLLLILRVYPPWQPMEMQSKQQVIGSTVATVVLCVFVWAFEVMWHFWAEMKRHSVALRQGGAPRQWHWWRPRVSGGEFPGMNKKQTVKHKLPHTTCWRLTWTLWTQMTQFSGLFEKISLHMVFSTKTYNQTDWRACFGKAWYLQPHNHKQWLRFCKTIFFLNEKSLCGLKMSWM